MSRPFCALFFAPKTKQSSHDLRRLYAILQPAVDRFRGLEAEAQEAFRKQLIAFRNLYGFLSQVMPYQDPDLEKLYTYGRFLLTKLPRDPSAPHYRFDDEVALEYYRLQKLSEGAIQLQPAINALLRQTVNAPCAFAETVKSLTTIAGAWTG